MNTIMLGNGLNRITYGCSWTNIVHTIDEDKKIIDGNAYLLEDKIPNTMQFNARTIKKMSIDNDTTSIKDADIAIKTQLQKMMDSYNPIHLHQLLLKVYPQHIITTNYDYAINKAIEESGIYSFYKIDDTYQEQKYSIRRCKKYLRNDNRSTITAWNIHGELNYINSIMLGYDHYCNTIGLIDAYLNGLYKYNKRLSRSRSMREKIIEKDTRVLSWIDLFFISDIHILGFGLGYEELDIWYVIMKRRELQIELGTDKICNKIYFYEKGTSKGKRELLEFYDIQVVDTNVEPDKDNYSPVYEDLIVKMIKNFKR